MTKYYQIERFATVNSIPGTIKKQKYTVFTIPGIHPFFFYLFEITTCLASCINSELALNHHA
ncbi:unnamed protein product [Cunninghamella echinulata]